MAVFLKLLQLVAVYFSCLAIFSAQYVALTKRIQHIATELLRLAMLIAAYFIKREQIVQHVAEDLVRLSLLGKASW